MTKRNGRCRLNKLSARAGSKEHSEKQIAINAQTLKIPVLKEAAGRQRKEVQEVQRKKKQFGILKKIQ